MQRIVKDAELWDGRYAGLQVTDCKGSWMELRVLATASDSSRAWDLRCYIREKLIEFIQQNYPSSLPQVRTRTTGDEEEPESRAAAPFMVQRSASE